MFPARIFTASLLFALGCSSTTECFSADATLLIQKSTVTGGQNVYIAAKALRIDNQKTGTTIVCKAPRWEVDLYNKRNRTSFHCAAEDFKASFFQSITKVYRDNLTNLKWKKEGVEQRDGISVLKMAVHLDGKQGKLDLMNVDVRNGEYFLATNFKLPPKVCNVLAVLTSMPPMGLIPIACTYYGVNSDSASPLVTKEIKKITVVDPFFETPKFAAAPSERDVFIDPAGREAIEDMFGDRTTPAK
ncbi:MAG: hypothetical protein JST89_15010 [Cyanobacteria bacterium SZAS-4]|nr:hypothetical protein [Cyanobacteria bacterium SZAS-4]